MFGPNIEDNGDSVVRFYISMILHDHLLHNFMLDSGAPHNLMPKIIMEKFGLQITKPYRDLYLFDSRKVKCLGMIKDLLVNLSQILVKIILMDVVVADVPKKYGMLLSRSWGAKVGGYLQLDMTYATIQLFGGKYNRLYRETKLAYTISDPKNPNNYIVYVVDQDLGGCLLSINSDLENCSETKQIDDCESLVNIEEGMRNMYFDGATSWEGYGVDILFVSSSGDKIILFYFRLQFETNSTNNVCEYEALVISLETTRKLKIKHLVVYGDVELIVKQIKQIYQAKHPRIR
jgi:hypothetical protein